jgi:hypothetical protein
MMENGVGNKDDFADGVLKRIARLVPNSFTMRNPGAKGAVKAARKYLLTINPTDFRVDSDELFQSVLNRHTDRLKSRLPDEARHWGLARKVLNLYLMEVNYNHFLRRRYRFHTLEHMLEVPVDSKVALGLRREAKNSGDQLPKWNGVINLSPTDNQAFQAFAVKRARRSGHCRVFLDLRFWARE